MTKQLIPRFTIHNIHDIAKASKTVGNFWLFIRELRIDSIIEEYLKGKLSIDKHINYGKFLNKIKRLDISLIKNIVPKFIVIQEFNKFAKHNEFDKNERILEILELAVGAGQLKISIPRPYWIQVEIWLNDDADLAALEFHQISNKELFFY